MEHWVAMDKGDVTFGYYQASQQNCTHTHTHRFTVFAVVTGETDGALG